MSTTQQRTAVLAVSGVQWASEKAVAESVLGRRPGVLSVEANPVSQTATVAYDPSRTSVAELAGWVRDCGYHCAGQSVPQHVCDPAAEPRDHVATHDGHWPVGTGAPDDHAATPPAAGPGTAHAGHDGMTPQDAMGHGGHHAGMSMDDMVRDMRNRFVVAALLSIPILLWSPIGREVLGFEAAAPFGLRDDVFSLVLSLPVVFCSAWIFFDGAYRAPRARTLDMMVLVAVAVGAGWLYSLVLLLSFSLVIGNESSSVCMGVFPKQNLPVCGRCVLYSSSHRSRSACSSSKVLYTFLRKATR